MKYFFSTLISFLHLSFPGISQDTTSIGHVTRKTCIEIFTGTWCAPCHFSNIDFRNNILPQISDYTIIAYHQGPDVFATWEGHNRAGYYGLNYVPSYVFDGKVSTLSLSEFNNCQSRPSFLKIEIENAIYNTSNVYVSGKILPLKNFPEAPYNLRIIILENENSTYQNFWDTIYYNVAVKMSPTEGGTSLNTPMKGIPIYFKQVIPIDTNFVQNMNNLSVVVLVQNDDDGLIEQSEWETIKSYNDRPFPNFQNAEVTIFPNPGNKYVVVKDCGPEMKIRIVNSLGVECLVSQKEYEKSVILDTSDLLNGIYFIKVNETQTFKFNKLN